MTATPQATRRLTRWLTFSVGGLIVLAGLVVACAGSLVNGSLRMSGVVVEAESGAPAAGAQMRIRRSRFSLLAEDFSDVDTTTEVLGDDGAFEVRCWSCAVIRIDFVKEGFHRAFETAAVDPEDRGQDRRSVDDLVVKLLPLGEAVALVRTSGQVTVPAQADDETSSAAASIVLPVGANAARALPLAMLEAGGGNDDATPAAYVRLVVERDGNGRVAMAKPPGRAWEQPVAAHLDFSAGGGGAIAFTPADRHVHRVALEMREAPADGYRPTLLLDPGAGESRHFYFRAGGHYGRGSVDPATYARRTTGDRIEVTVRLWVNPEPGNRSLEPR